MNFWDDSLRICPKCKSIVNITNEPKIPCPKCGGTVWFYNFRLLPEPPQLPELRTQAFLGESASLVFAAAVLIFAIISLIGIFSNLIVVAMSGMALISMSVFTVMRHRDARLLESQIELAHQHQERAQQLQDRVKECVSRYNSLLRTGDSRIERYFGEIYLQAENEKREAEAIRQQAVLERQAIATVENRIYAMAEKLVGDHLKWVSQKLRPDPENYQRRKVELEKTFDFVIQIGYPLPKDIQKEAVQKLKSDYQSLVREHALREEQRRIQQKMRQEEREQRELEKALREAEAKEKEIEDRIQQALVAQQGTMDSELEELRQQLLEAQANAERAKSMAQITKSGHVYILSNIGSFGENVFKIGMTRRLDPQDRVNELGDASVPFPFDVHAMISCNDAPKLESTLHRELARYRVNRVNFRKEYFRLPLSEIVDCVQENHGSIEYIAVPEALQYRESLEIAPEQVEELESELEEMGIDFEESDE
jgi:T5orf172 domain